MGFVAGRGGPVMNPITGSAINVDVETGMRLLSLVIFFPLIWACILMCFPAKAEKAIKYFALAGTVITFGLSIFLLTKFIGGTYHFQLSECVPWIPSLGINYRVGVDGISIWLILLTTFLSVISTWFSFYIKNRLKHYMIFMLILETAMLGVFVSLDLILFYTFFEASLIPMFFLIAIWGGERRAYASMKFLIYTFAGSIFMLVAIIAMYMLQKNATGVISFDLLRLQSSIANGQLWKGNLHLETLFFWAFAIGFLIKTPAFPFHTWLPDAHVEAPTAGSVILAGVLLKMGTYGFLRFCLPLFPDVAPQMTPWLMGLAVIGIIYGAIVAAVQPDLKKLIAYSSVAHMGFVMIGIFSLTHNGMMGGSMQQLSHGISTGALFLLVGLIYERRHTRMFKEFGGLKQRMPIYAAIFLIVMLSSVGLPGTNGFIGEFLALLGTFEASFAQLHGLNVMYATIAGFGVILAAVYLLSMFMKVFYGPLDNPENERLRDIKPWEIAMCATLILFILWGGLYPNTFLKPMEKSIAATRLMAISSEGHRPTWLDPSLEIDDQMNLVRVKDRTTDMSLPPNFRDAVLVTPADLHVPLPSQQEVAMQAPKEVAR
jgi:NADH-quinone oxidoreductase subunit M